jgi:hypothetical protein
MPGGKTTTKTQESNPWAPAQRPLERSINQSENVGAGAFMPHTSGATLRGINQLDQIGRDGSVATDILQEGADGYRQGFQTGLGGLTKTATGENLDGNPYLKSVLDTAGQETADQVNAQFSGAGRYGSAAHSKTLADEIGNQRQAAMMGNYNTERGYQNQAQSQMYGSGQAAGNMAQQADQSRMFGANASLQAGQIRDQIEERKRMAPLAAMDYRRNAALGIGSQFGSQTQTSETPSNVPGMILGGAMMAGGAMSGNPMMAMQGAGQLAGGMSGGADGGFEGGFGGPSAGGSFGQLGSGVQGLLAGGTGGSYGGLTGFKQGMQGLQNPSNWAPTVTRY